MSRIDDHQAIAYSRALIQRSLELLKRSREAMPDRYLMRSHGANAVEAEAILVQSAVRKRDSSRMNREIIARGVIVRSRAD